nr:GGDEF domain-containing protein [Hyphomonas sp. Mor2]
MQAAVKEQVPEQSPAPQPNERSLIFRRCKAAFQEIQKHGTPPDPTTYALWYAYVARTPPAVTVAVDKLLASGRALDRYELAEIHREFLADNSADAAQEAIGKEFEESIQDVSELIKSGMSQNAEFCSTLHGIETSTQKQDANGDFKAMLSQLVSESLKMAEASSRLSQGLLQTQERVKKLNDELEQARKQSMLDPLTAVCNRRAFEDRMNWQIEDARENGSTFCLVLADLDEFKRVNDTYGHQTGDEVLKKFASLLFEHTKGQDLVARYGGDEFAIILPNIEITSAYNLMVSIKHKFEGTRMPSNSGHAGLASATASFGISGYKDRRSSEDMVAGADTALSRAKTTGRNRVCAEGLS